MTNFHEFIVVQQNWGVGFFDMLTLFVTVVAGSLFLNAKRHKLRDLVLCAGFALVSGCAFGRALAYVWPGDHSEIVPLLRVGVDVGLMVVFCALARGELLRMLHEPHAPTFYREVLKAASVAETVEDFVLVRRAAQTAIRIEGKERRVNPRPQKNPGNDEVEEQGRLA